MNFFSYFITFAVSWWIFLFMLLPVGAAASETVEKGHAKSAPKKPMLIKKMLWATMISAIFSYVFLFVIYGGYLDFLEIRAN